MQVTDLSRLVAASERRQAALAALTPEQAEERARYYDEQGKRYLRLSAAKRRQGQGDCSREMAAAERQAARAVFAPAVSTAAPRRTHTPSGRPAAARSRRTATSRDDGDNGDDGAQSRPAPQARPGPPR
jgi:hypothetical protein